MIVGLTTRLGAILKDNGLVTLLFGNTVWSCVPWNVGVKRLWRRLKKREYEMMINNEDECIASGQMRYQQKRDKNTTDQSKTIRTWMTA